MTVLLYPKFVLLNVRFRRCPMCRTEIHCWTTKRCVQLTLDIQRQLEDVPLDEHRQQEEVHLNEQMQQEEVHLNEQRQQEEVHLNEQKQQEEVHLNERRQQEEVHLNEQRQQEEVYLNEQRQQEEVHLNEQRQQEEVHLNEQRQQEDVHLNEQRQQEDVHLNEKRQQEDVLVDEHRQMDEVSQTPNKEEGFTSKNIFYELCRFDSLNNFLNCLKCLNFKKDQLSLFEILLILRANLCLFRCVEHGNAFIEKFKFEARAMSLTFNFIESTIRFLLTEVQNGRLTMPSQGSYRPNTELMCVMEIKEIVQEDLVHLFAAQFPKHHEEIFEHERVTLKMLDEIEHFFSDCMK